jgi:hypothetical protein
VSEEYKLLWKRDLKTIDDCIAWNISGYRTMSSN